jgi:BirA family biotin operon repressor/biotin-[acetyl-CoA-carboxylase] ligase
VLSQAGIQAVLGTAVIGRQLVHLAETGSTNDVAKQMALQGAADGAVVVAEYQTSGRGRLGRRWEAPPGTNLLLSILLRLDLDPHRVQQVTMISALAVADAVQECAGLAVGLKWPNDIVLNGAKLAGILTELGLERDRLSYAVVGIGLNVNLEARELPAGLPFPATSLLQALVRPVDRHALLLALLRALDVRYLALRRGRSPREEWAARLETLGRPVTVTQQATKWDGVAEAVDGDGALIVRLADGTKERVLAGDVTLRTDANYTGRSSSAIIQGAAQVLERI